MEVNRRLSFHPRELIFDFCVLRFCFLSILQLCREPGSPGRARLYLPLYETFSFSQYHNPDLTLIHTSFEAQREGKLLVDI